MLEDFYRDRAYLVLGRPWNIIDLDRVLDAMMLSGILLDPVIRRQPIVRIAGDGSNEGPLYHEIAVLVSQLKRRHDLKITVCGSPFVDELPPRPQDCSVAVLLEAPLYAKLKEWEEPNDKQTVFLVGHRSDWETPDVILPEFPGVRDALEKEVAPWLAACLQGDKSALAAAISCDTNQISENLIEIHKPHTFDGTGWFSWPIGPWLARDLSIAAAKEVPRFVSSIQDLKKHGGRWERGVDLWLQDYSRR